MSGEKLLHVWKLCSTVPYGYKLFSTVLGIFVPYTGRLGASVTELSPGKSKVVLGDTRPVRNHLKSVHAMALANLGEVATGLALITSLPQNARCILVGFEIEYIKKARGKLTSSCDVPVSESNEKRDVEIIGDIKDAKNETVARVKAKWRVGPAA